MMSRAAASIRATSWPRKLRTKPTRNSTPSSPPEPARFVVQLHDATTLHFDLRLQMGEVMRSWAVPKGPSLDPAIRRLAVQVEDHTISSGEFEGIREGQIRGSGAVIVWDEGTVEILRDEPDHLSFFLHGHKLVGRFGLSRTGGRHWILVKADDQSGRRGSDIVAEQPASVRSGLTWQQLKATLATSSASFPAESSAQVWRLVTEWHG